MINNFINVLMSIIRHMIIFLLLSYVTIAYSQNLGNEHNYSHLKGLQLISSGNINEAIKNFKFSADSFSNADSYYELAKIYFKKNTVESRVLARKYIQNAIWNDKKNIEYYLLKAKLMEKFSRKMAYDVYEDILNIDTNCTEALFNLGKIKELDFYEYNNSVLKVNSDPSLSFDEFAIEDYLKAETFFRRTIKSDSNRTGQLETFPETTTVVTGLRKIGSQTHGGRAQSSSIVTTSIISLGRMDATGDVSSRSATQSSGTTSPVMEGRSGSAQRTIHQP